MRLLPPLLLREDELRPEDALRLDEDESRLRLDEDEPRLRLEEDEPRELPVRLAALAREPDELERLFEPALRLFELLEPALRLFELLDPRLLERELPDEPPLFERELPDERLRPPLSRA